MKKSLILIIASLFLIPAVFAQTAYAANQDVVTTSLAELKTLIINIVSFIGRQIIYAFAFAFGFQSADALGLSIGFIFAFLIWLLLITKIAGMLKSFSSFSTMTSWIISIGLTIILAAGGAIKALGVGFALLIASFTTSTGRELLLGIAIIAAIYFIISLITGQIGQAANKRKKAMKKAKAEAGEKILEKIGESGEK